MTRRERDEAQMWMTLLVVALAMALCLAWLASVLERVAPDLAPGVAAVTSGTEPPCGNCGVIENVRELRAAAARQEGAPHAAGGRAGIVMIILAALGGNFRIDPAKIYEVEVRMQDGSVRTIQSTTAPARRSGDRVRVVSGRIEQIS